MTSVRRVWPGDTVPTSGGWSLVLTAAGKKSAVVYLPCGHATVLDGSHHTINECGEIQPSVICTSEHGCAFHDHIALRSWTP